MSSGIPFVGRERELARLSDLMADVRAGGSGCLVVVGAAGVGKSALLEQAARRGAGLRILRAVGAETESEVSFAALDALLRPIVDLRAQLPQVQATALERALALAAGPPPDPLAVGAATLGLLAAAAAPGVLCLIDDAHWIDGASLAALTFAARRLDREGVGLVLATRAGEAPPAVTRDIEVLALEGLDDDDARHILGALSPHPLDVDLTTQLVDAARGNPLVLRELHGRLDAAQREGREAVSGPPRPSAEAEELLGERLAKLPRAARLALLVVCTGERGDRTFALAALSAASLSLDDLEPAESAGLIALGPDGLSLDHPLVRSVVYHQHAPAERRRAHAAVAAAYERSDVRRAWHLAAAAARPDEEVAALLEEAAGAARVRGGYVSAARAERRASDLTPDPGTRARRLLAAADDFEMAGLADEAAAVLDQAGALATDPTTAARIRGLQAHLLLWRGQPGAARPRLVEEAELLLAGAPVPAARYLLEAAWASMLLGDLEGWTEHARRARALVADAGGPTHRVAMAMHASALVAGGRAAEASEDLREVEDRILAPTGEPVLGAVEVYALMVDALVSVERWTAAERLLERLVGDARATGAGSVLPYVLVAQGGLDLRRGRLSTARTALDDAVALTEEAGQDSALAAALGTRALVNAGLGDEGAAERDAERAVTLAGRAAPAFASRPRHALGLLAVVRGQLEAAVDHLRAAAGGDAAPAPPEPGSRPWQPDLIEALIRYGDRGAARLLLDGWRRDGEAHGRLFARATAARCAALLAGDTEIDERFATALALHEALPMPFERARTLLCFGERLRRARRRVDARAPLREALAIFEALPASGWATRARVELRATGGMVPARQRPELAELTAHEVQVALLVAEGRTNREVAGALFVAPKTIEHHLSAIFRKLGITRRTELARVFAAELADRAG